MRYTIIFDDELNEETVSKLIGDIQLFAKDYSTNEFEIIFTSEGGDVASSKKLLHFVNNSGFDFVFSGIEYISSCAFDMFISLDCKKKLIGVTIATLHLTSCSYSYIGLKNKKSFENFDRDELKKENKQLIAFFKSLNFLSKQEIKDIEEGKDVYINSDRMHKLINND